MFSLLVNEAILKQTETLKTQYFRLQMECSLHKHNAINGETRNENITKKKNIFLHSELKSLCSSINQVLNISFQ